MEKGVQGYLAKIKNRLRNENKANNIHIDRDIMMFI